MSFDDLYIKEKKKNMSKEDFIKQKIYEDVFNNELIKKHEIIFMGEVKVDECIFTPKFNAITYKVSHDCGWWSGFIKLEDVNREWRDLQLSKLL